MKINVGNISIYYKIIKVNMENKDLFLLKTNPIDSLI